MKTESLPLDPNGLNKAREHGTLSGEVRLLKWGAGLLVALVFAALGFLYENQAEIRERLTRVEEGVVRVEAQTARIEDHVVRVEERVVRIEERVVRIENQVIRIENQVVRLEERLGGIENLLRTLFATRNEDS